jgi:hypothetical protein
MLADEPAGVIGPGECGDEIRTEPPASTCRGLGARAEVPCRFSSGMVGCLSRARFRPAGAFEALPTVLRSSRCIDIMRNSLLLWTAWAMALPAGAGHPGVRTQGGQERHAVAVVVEGERGTRDLAGVVVSLICADAPERNQLVVISDEEATPDGGYRFEFTGVPAGTYRCVLTPNNNLKWNDLSVTVQPPQEDVRFVCYDAGTTYDLQLAPQREGMESTSLTYMVWMGDRSRPLSWHWKTGIYEGISSGEKLRWVARAKGFKLAMGEFAGERKDGMEVIPVHLEEGWGHVFHAESPSVGALEGVEVVLDGRSAGRTDERGFLYVNREQAPEEVDFVRPGWRVVSSPIDVASSPFVNGLYARIYLERE